MVRLVHGHLRAAREYTVPVGRHESDGELVVSAAGTWRHNLRGGAPVRVVLDGKARAAYAELEEDPDHVAQTYAELVIRVGVRKAGQVGLKVVDRLPTAREIAPAVAERGIARIRLSEN